MIKLSSDLFRLDPIEIGAITEDYLATLNDHEYMKFSRHSKSISSKASQEKYISEFNCFDKWILGVTDLLENTLVGTTNLHFNYNYHTINIGFLIFKPYTGRGIASQVLDLLINYLTVHFPRFRMVIGTNTSNGPMRKVAKTAKFKLDEKFNLEKQENVTYYCDIPALNNNCKPRIPPLIDWAKNIGVASNDAGGAEHIVWLLRNFDHPVTALIQGPAIKIFEKAGFEFQIASTFQQLLESNLIITGSGWMSELENKVIRECTVNQVPTITVLDHWVNYKERFEREPKVIPNMLAVTNSLALGLASDLFPKAPVWLLPDSQLEDYKNLIRKFPSGNKVLVLLEPTSSLSNEFSISDNMNLELIEKAVELNMRRKLTGVVLRLHPSQVAGDPKFQVMRSRFPEITFSDEKDLADDLKFSAIVLGFSTYGLYISAMCGIETRSYFKSNATHWVKFFKEIGPLDSR